MGLMKIAVAPPATVTPYGTVLEAVLLMKARSVDAVAVVEEHGKLLGIFTAGDLAKRVVSEGLDPGQTRVASVMTRGVESATRELRYGEAPRRMLGQNFRHLPVVDGGQRVIGMVSLRALLESRVDELVEELNSVVTYFAADGPGG